MNLQCDVIVRNVLRLSHEATGIWPRSRSRVEPKRLGAKGYS